MVKILYISSNEWGNLGRRKVRIAYELARLPEISAVLYVNPPVETSFLDVLRGSFLPSHLGENRQGHIHALIGKSRMINERLWVYTGSTKTLPLTRSPRLRQSQLLLSANQRRYMKGIRNLINHLPGGQMVLWVSHPLHDFYLDEFDDAALTCYDWTDDWTQYTLLPVKNREDLVRKNEHILDKVDIVWAVSTTLYQKAREYKQGTYRMPNATDFELLSTAARSEGEIAEDLLEIPPPRLGYIGQIGENIDYDLIAQIAGDRPEWSWVFIGPCWGTRTDEIQRLDTLSNIHFLGGRPHESLPSYLRGFDICVMPHLDNALTRSMDPTKLYDYLASGRPIVSTAVAGTEGFRDVIYIGRTVAEFRRGIEFAQRENSRNQELRLLYAKEHSWPRRTQEIWGLLKKHLNLED